MTETHESEAISFRTGQILYTDIYSDKAYKKHEVFPLNGGLFTFTLLSCFLNEHDDFVKKPDKAYQNADGEQTFKFKHSTEKQYSITVKISDAIHVFVSTCYLLAQWVKEEFTAVTMYGSMRRLLKKPKYAKLVVFSKYITEPKQTTQYLYYHSPIMFCSKSDFSCCFRFFASRVKNLDNIEDTSLIHDYKDVFITEKSFSIRSLSELSQNLSGFLILNIEPAQCRKHLKLIRKDGHPYYIVSGIYISPCARSILLENQVLNGFLLDTTWKVMPKYVTSIIMGSLYNTGVGLGFSFGRGEDKEIYSSLLREISRRYSYSFESKVLESDQGSALKSVADEFKMKHLACLRHLLVSLKYNEVSYLVGIILRTVSDTDYQRALNFINTFIDEKLTDENKITEANKIFQKVGLSILNHRVEISNEERWDSVSMHCRTKYKMPSTTNSLESTHGHLNKKTPRNNNFYMSIYRIGTNILKKTQNLDTSICTNYNRAKYNSINYANITSEDKMQREIWFYHTTVDQCQCSENKLLSSMLGIDVPCCHRYKLGAKFPDCPKAKLNINKKQATAQSLQQSQQPLHMSQSQHLHSQQKKVCIPSCIESQSQEIEVLVGSLSLSVWEVVVGSLRLSVW